MDWWFGLKTRVKKTERSQEGGPSFWLEKLRPHSRASASLLTLPGMLFPHVPPRLTLSPLIRVLPYHRVSSTTLCTITSNQCPNPYPSSITLHPLPANVTSENLSPLAILCICLFNCLSVAIWVPWELQFFSILFPVLSSVFKIAPGIWSLSIYLCLMTKSIKIGNDERENTKVV